MTEKRQHLRTPAISTAGSFLFLLLCAALSDPFNNVAIIVIFLFILVIFLVSFGHLWLYARKGHVEVRDRYKIFVVSIVLVAILMFRSSQSLSLIDFLILILITFGLLFYGNKRAS